jgi:hypothetical protein
MNPFRFILTIVSFLMLCNSCKEPEPVPNNCDASILSNPDTRNVYIRMKIPNTTLPGNELEIYDANSLDIEGVLTQISCEGAPGVSFTINPTADFSVMSHDSIAKGFFLEGFNPFTFVNSGDYLLLSAKLKAHFNNGRVFDSDEISLLVTYPDLGYDSVTSVSYMEAIIPTSTHWYQVSK